MNFLVINKDDPIPCVANGVVILNGTKNPFRSASKLIAAGVPVWYNSPCMGIKGAKEKIIKRMNKEVVSDSNNQ